MKFLSLRCNTKTESDFWQILNNPSTTRMDYMSTLTHHQAIQQRSGNFNLRQPFVEQLFVLLKVFTTHHR